MGESIRQGRWAGKIQNKGKQFKVLGPRGGRERTREGRGMDKSMGEGEDKWNGWDGNSS